METDALKTRLLEEAKKLETELAAIGNRNPQNAVDWDPKPQDTGLEADPNIVADQMEGYSENAAILEDLEIRYREVQAALARIDAGTYGTCTIGGEAIAPERLEADPAAATCSAHLS